MITPLSPTPRRLAKPSTMLTGEEQPELAGYGQSALDPTTTMTGASPQQPGAALEDYVIPSRPTDLMAESQPGAFPSVKLARRRLAPPPGGIVPGGF